jgi:hypothetical protein
MAAGWRRLTWVLHYILFQLGGELAMGYRFRHYYTKEPLQKWVGNRV